MKFLSDNELAKITGLSRPTVRKALGDMEREGWIERRQGRGTFVGPRAPLNLALRLGLAPARQTVRLAVVINLLGNFDADWYAHEVIAGIDEAAAEARVSLELLGGQDGNVKSVSQRLMQTRPDVLAFTAPPVRHALLIGESRRLDIPSIGTGSFLETLGVPTVREDGPAAAAAAVRSLAALGHRRIGFVQVDYPVPWVFQRRQGYMDGLDQVGLDQDERLVLWLPGVEEPARRDLFERYLDRAKPTALLFGSYSVVRYLAPLVRAGRVRVPQDLSVVHFDQHPETQNWLGGVKPTVLSLPLREMGRRLAHMARRIADRQEVPAVTDLPCALVEGGSVAGPATA